MKNAAPTLLAASGVLIQLIGLWGVYALGAVLYLLAALLVLPVAYRSSSPSGAGSSLLAMLRDGWRFARGQRQIVGTLAVTVIVNLWGFAYITMVPVIGERPLGLTPVLIGVLMSTEGVGAVLLGMEQANVELSSRLRATLNTTIQRIERAPVFAQ